MRQLKFRIWNGFQFVTKSEVYIKACNGSLWDYDDGNLWSATAKIQQFTGLLDKNGTDIYEGDILYCIDDFADNEHSAKFTVLWDDDRWVFQKKGDEKYGGGHDWREVNKDCKIIGNIFENSELLKA